MRVPNLAAFAAEVNRLGRVEVERINNEFEEGKRCFRAVHNEYPEAMLQWYWNQGYTPKRALKSIHFNGVEP